MTLKFSKANHTQKVMVIFCVTVLLVFYSASAFAMEDPKVKWRFKTQGPIRSAVVMDNDIIYFGSADGSLYAVSKSGTLKWKYQTNGAIAGSPILHNELVIVTSRDNFVYAVNRQSGLLVWKFQMDVILAAYTEWEYFTAAPVVSNDKVLAASGDGHLYALDIASGKMIWKFKGTGRMRATPLVHDGKIYQPCNDGYVYVLSEKDGALDWKFQTDGVSHDYSAGFDRKCIFTKPSIANGLLIFGSRDGHVYAVDLATRKERWRFTYGTTWAMSTLVHEDAVYVGWSTNRLICALDLNTGQEKWRQTVGSVTYTTAAVDGANVIFGSADGNLYSFNRSSGEVAWQFHTGREIFSSPVIDSTHIYFGCDNGYLYALEDNHNVRSLRAVYQPFPDDKTHYPLIDPAITPYLKSKGFAVLDSASLVPFIRRRIKDQAPSVIVFAFDMIPMNLIGKDPTRGLIRKYLEAGGKILWFGGIPMRFEFNSKGYYVANHGTALAEQLLDVKFTSPEESGNYYSRATQEGLNYGLPQWFKTTHAVVAPDGVTPLAIDEYNRVSAWIKKFNDRSGSGFVSCRTWAWEVPITNEDLEIIRQLALYGLP